VTEWIVSRISSFQVGGPSSSTWSGGALSGAGCVVPLPFAAGGYRSYPEFWVVTRTCGTRGTRPRQ
jgi:hypothetical protein